MDKLLAIYKKYIDISLYRVVPVCDYNRIIKQGINPLVNPYEEIIPFVRKLSKMIIKREKQGDVIFLKWGDVAVSGAYALGVTLNDFSLPCVDFSPRKKDVNYYLGFKGGAANANLKKICNILLSDESNLSNEEFKIIKKIKDFTAIRECDNVGFYINGISKFLENAFFSPRKKHKSTLQDKFKKKKYLPSPFGSFEHFNKIIKKNGLNAYLSYLKTKMFFLRVKNKIPAEEARKL